MIRPHFVWHLNFFVLLFFLIFTHLSVCFAQDSFSWDSIQTGKEYFTALHFADSLTFQREFENPFLLLLDKDAEQHYLEFNSLEERKRFISIYWIAVNPNPLLPENDGLLDFIRRCAYVEKHFSSSEPPYFDDRGKYYLKYGEPSVRYEDKGGMESVRFFTSFRMEYKLITSSYENNHRIPPWDDYSVRPHEIWTYEHIDPYFIVYFVKRGKNFQEIQNLKRIIPSIRSLDFSWYWSDYIKKRAWISPVLQEAADDVEEFEDAIRNVIVNGYFSIPRLALDFRKGKPHRHLTEREFIYTNYEQAIRRSQPVTAYEPVNAFNTIRFHKDIAQFHNSNNTTRLEITFLSSFEENWANGDSLDLTDTLNIAFISLLRDTIYNSISQDKIMTRFPLQLAASENIPNAIEKLTLTSPSQQGDLTVHVEDINNDKIGFNREKINIRDFSGDDLMISDIQLLTKVTDEKQKKMLPVFEEQSLIVAPYPYKEIKKSLPAYCYFEIYNLKTANILGEYEITLTISYDKNQDSAFKRFGKWATRSKDTHLSITHTQQVISATSEELIALDLSNLSNAAYHLEVSVSEMGDEKTITSIQKNITIVD